MSISRNPLAGNKNEEKNWQFQVSKPYSRLDHFLRDSIPQVSRAQIEKWIQSGWVHRNGQPVLKKNHTLNPGDCLLIDFPPATESPYFPSQPLIKLFEDPYLLIIDKPAGLAVHPGAGLKDSETLVKIFLYYYPQLSNLGELDRPGIVHRLDKDTSGVMVLAKEEKTLEALKLAFKNREIKKTYLALVQGQMKWIQGDINAAIARHSRHREKFTMIPTASTGRVREALTHYQVIRQFKQFAWVRLFPHTGRTHQLRVHLAGIGNPILGDPLYGKASVFPRLALHAYSLALVHPRTGYLIYARSSFPEVFRQFLQIALKNEPLPKKTFPDKI